MEWEDGNKNSANLGTKNLVRASHKKHTTQFAETTMTSNQFKMREGVREQLSSDFKHPNFFEFKHKINRN